jgi:hypothetical protein
MVKWPRPTPAVVTTEDEPWVSMLSFDPAEVQL